MSLKRVSAPASLPVGSPPSRSILNLALKAVENLEEQGPEGVKTPSSKTAVTKYSRPHDADRNRTHQALDGAPRRGRAARVGGRTSRVDRAHAEEAAQEEEGKGEGRAGGPRGAVREPPGQIVASIPGGLCLSATDSGALRWNHATATR